VLIARLSACRPAARAALFAGAPVCAAILLAAQFAVRRFGSSFDLAYSTAWLLFGSGLLALQLWPALQRPLTWWPLQRLGDLSLAIYLVHIPVTIVMLLALGWAHQDIPFAAPGFWSAYILLVILAAGAAHWGFELPARRWLRQRVANAPFGMAAAEPAA
jgi:peptidoglycan/LPS O-acetylase OafA/YrhL